MTTLLGLFLLITSMAVTLTGTLLNAGGSQGFLFGVEVGVIGMIGLGLVRSDVGRRTAAHRLRVATDRGRRETGLALQERDRLVRELRDERARPPVAHAEPLTTRS
jgi:hypothetical protein